MKSTDTLLDISGLLPSPTLTHVEIANLALNQETLEDLAEGRLGPNLQRLGIRRLRDVRVDDFLKMVLARNANLKRAGKEFKWIILYRPMLLDKELKALNGILTMNTNKN